MNIPLVSASIAQLPETTAVAPVGNSAAPLPLVDPTNPGGGSAIVQLSDFGQLAAAAAGFQTSLDALAPDGGGIEQNFGSDIGSVAAQAQYLVDAFNGLQSTLGTIAATGGTPAAGLAAQIAAQLDTQATASYSNGASSLTTLAQIGVNFQPASAVGGSLNIDMAALTAAFQADPAATMALLTQAVSAFDNLAGNAVAVTGGPLSSLSTQVAAEAAQESLLVNALRDMSSLLGSNAAPAGTADQTMGLETLLALESSTSFARNYSPLVALSEFNVVSSLLG